MLAPQSDEEVRPVIEALRRLDPLLDIIWNPQAFMTRAGNFDVTGRGTTKPEYAARWQVIRRDVATSLHKERDYTVICTVTECDRTGRYPIMVAQGDYAPIGPWLIEYMSVWDAAQRTMVDALDRQWAEHEKIDELTQSRDAHQEAAERIYREHGSEYWMGGAQGRAAPETARTLYGTAPGAPPPADGSSPPGSPPENTNDTDTAFEGRAQIAAALAASTP